MTRPKQKKLVWTPKITLHELVAEMVRGDLKSAKRDELVKKHGVMAYDYHEEKMSISVQHFPLKCQKKCA